MNNTMVAKSSGTYQLSFSDIFEATAIDDKRSVNNAPQNNNPVQNSSLERIKDNGDVKLKYAKNKVSFSKEIELIIEQFFAGKI